MPDGTQIDVAAHIEAVARRLYGDPNQHLSTLTQLRFGTHGSLSVEVGGKNAGTWYDHETKTGGGTLDLIHHRLGLVNGQALVWLRGIIIGAQQLKRFTEPQRTLHKRIVEIYDYETEDGELLFQAVRYEPKTFKQRRPDGRGGWLWNLDDTRIVPYRLSTFAGGIGTVYIVEGEKDADALHRLGFAATTNPMGAGKWPEHFAEHFVGLDVVILPDNDDVGRGHAVQVACNLAPVADRVRIVELPDLPHKGDVSDWIAAGGTAAQLCALAAAAQTFATATAHIENTGNTSAAAPGSRRKRIGAGIILGAVYEPLRWIVPDYLPEGLSILAGRQKLGKTWLALDWALAVATGGAAMGNISIARGDVLYIDLENGERRVQRRLERIFPYAPARPDLSRLQFQFEASELGPELIAELDDWRESVETPRLIVIDVLQRIKPVGRAARNSYENDYAALADLQRWATEHGIAVLVLHHTRKGGADDPLEALSGSNGLSACADTTLVLDRTMGGMTLYCRGRDVDERETALRFDAGLWSILGDADEWKQSSERAAISKVLKDADEPMRPADIAAATGMSSGNVRKLLFTMGKAGLLTKAGYGRYVHPDRADIGEDTDEDNVVEFPARGRRRKPGNTGNTGNSSAKSEGNCRPADASSVTGPETTGNTEGGEDA